MKNYIEKVVAENTCCEELERQLGRELFDQVAVMVEGADSKALDMDVGMERLDVYFPLDTAQDFWKYLTQYGQMVRYAKLTRFMGKNRFQIIEWVKG